MSCQSGQSGLVKFNQLCRTCCSPLADKSRRFFNIFASDKIFQKLKLFLAVEIEEGDGLPQCICEKCLQTLQSSLLFREISVKNHYSLKDFKNKIEEKKRHQQSEKDGEAALNAARSGLGLQGPKGNIIVGEREQTNCNFLQKTNFEVGRIPPAGPMVSPTLNAAYKVIPELKRQNVKTHLTESRICGEICIKTETEDNPCEYKLRDLPNDKNLRDAEKPEDKLICRVPIYLGDTNFKFCPSKEFLHCNFCSKKYLSKETLEGHILGHVSNEPAYWCESCQKGFTSWAGLRNHKKRHSKSWTHVCELCNKGFVGKTQLIYHTRSQHTKEKPFKCDKCSRAFYANKDLKMHFQRVHCSPPENFMQACPTCNKVFRGKYYLKLHMKRHLPLAQRRKYKCNKCTSSFTTSSALKKHIFSHTGVRPFECEICGTKLKTKKGYEMHVLNHSGIKSFMCDVCGKSFALENTLKMHIRTHTGEKPHLCNLCGKRFTQPSSYKIHMKGCGKK